MNPSYIATIAVESHYNELRRRADAAVLARAPRGRRRGRREPARTHEPDGYAEHVVIRSALRSDEVAVRRLAELDGGHVPEGEVLVAELQGELVAAVGLDGGGPVADPFRPSGDIARLLELRADQLRAANGDPDAGLSALRERSPRGAVGILRLMRRQPTGV